MRMLPKQIRIYVPVAGCRLPQFFYSCYGFYFVFQITLLIISGEWVPRGVDFLGESDNIARVSYGRTFEMENDDIEILLNDIRKFSGSSQHVKNQPKFKRMATTNLNNGWLPSVGISPANMSFIDEEEPLIIECNVNTSDAATVLIKHNGEIKHEQHIL